MRRMLKLFNIDSILNDLDFLSSFFARSERGKRQLRAQSRTEYRFAFWSDVRRGVAATLSEVVTAAKAMIERTILTMTGAAARLTLTPALDAMTHPISLF